MLVRDHVIFVLGIDRLVVRRDVDVVVRKLVATEVVKEVGEATRGKVDVRASGIFRLLLISAVL